MARNERRHFRERGKSSAGLIKPGKGGGRRSAESGTRGVRSFVSRRPGKYFDREKEETN